MFPLSDGEQAFLHAIREGQSAASYARDHNYGPDWAKWISKKIRRKLGVTTLQEAIEMSESATVTRADLERLEKMQGDLTKALEELREASTASEQAAARKDVGEARSDLAGELRLRGLTTKDLDRIQEIKETEKFEKFYANKRAEEEAAKPKPKRRKPKEKEEPGEPKKEPNAFAKLFASKRDDDEPDDDEPDDD